MSASAIAWARSALAALVLPALVLSSCSEPAVPGVTVLATVAGQPVTQPLFEAYVIQRTGRRASDLGPEQKAQLLDDLLRLSAAASIAQQLGEQLTDTQAELRRLETAAKKAAATAGVFRMPSDDDLRAEYELFVATRPSVEYRAAHILVPTQAQAKEVAARLSNGEEFDALATEFSVDQSAGAGGNLGWLDPTVLPSEFVAAIRELVPGTNSPNPLKTKYGWHVIRLIETRPAAAIPMQEVRAQLVVAIQQRRYEEYLDSVIDKVKIVRMLP